MFSKDSMLVIEHLKQINWKKTTYHAIRALCTSMDINANDQSGVAVAILSGMF